MYLKTIIMNHESIIMLLKISLFSDEHKTTRTKIRTEIRTKKEQKEYLE